MNLLRDIREALQRISDFITDCTHKPMLTTQLVQAQLARGFTIIELLVTIAVIGVLAGMLVPALSTARREARIVKCINNQAQIVKAIHMYANIYGDGKIRPNAGYIQGPPETNTSEYRIWYKGAPTGLGVLRKKNLIDSGVFFCPEADNFTENGTYGIQKWGATKLSDYVASSYLYRGWENNGSSFIDKMFDKAILMDCNRQLGSVKNANHKLIHVNIAKGDGSVVKVSDDRVDSLVQYTGITFSTLWQNADSLK